jgi:hypothetical protein
MLGAMRILFFTLLVLSLPLQAEIYRWVDGQGNVIFSDEPHPDAEQVELLPGTTYTPQVHQTEPDVIKLSPEDRQSPVPDYSLRIITPSDGETTWINNGDVRVSLIVEPALDPERGDMIRIALDGQVKATQSSTSVTLQAVDRGAHTLTAEVIDVNNQVLTTASPVRFQLHRATAN